MKIAGKLSDVLEAADKLSLDEQELIVDVLRRRMLEKKRKELTAIVREAEKEYQEGRCREATPEEIMNEILS